MRIAVHERALAFAVERAARPASARRRASASGTKPVGQAVGEIVDRHLHHRRAAVAARRAPRRDPRQVAVGREARALPVLRVQRASCSTMSVMRASMSASSRVGEAAARRDEVFEHHHVAVVGVVAGAFELRVPRPAGRAPAARARDRGRAAPRPLPCPARSRTCAVARRTARASRTPSREGDGSPSNARCARPVVPEWRSSTVTDVTSVSIASDIHSGVRSSTSTGSCRHHLDTTQYGPQPHARAGIVRSCWPAGRPARCRSTASKPPSRRFPRWVRARRCSRCATSASTRRSAAGSTSAATTCRAWRSASASAPTVWAWSSRPTTRTSIRSAERSCT